MAAGVTVQSILGSIIQGHLECSICHTRYQEPKMLDCPHSFCLGCLQEIQSQNPDNENNMIIICPLCQRQTILPDGGMVKLPNNYTLTALVEEVTQQERLLHGERSKVICQACREENEAISHCIDCEQHLCKECQKAHQRWAALRTHKLTALTDEHDESESAAEKNSKKNISRCGTHPGQELCSYCITCEVLICNQCAVSHHREPMHTSVSFNTAVDICLKEAQERTSQGYDDEASPKLSSSWTSLRDRLRIMLAETNRQICQNADEKISRIRREEIQLKHTAQATYRQKDKKLAEMAFAELTLKMVHSEMTEANCCRVLKFRQEFLHDYKDLPKVLTGDVTHDLSFIGFRDVHHGVELGTILLEEKWEPTSQSDAVKGRAIALFSTGDMVVANTTLRKLTKMCPDGKILDVSTVSQLEGCDEDPNSMKRPTDLAVNKDDHLIITVDSEVKIFNKEYQLLRQFAVGGGEDEADNSNATCLAVDDSNLIAVGYEDKEQISLHDQDGSLIRTLPAPMIAKALTISNHRLIYTSYKEEKIMCMDFMGNNIFTVNTPESSGPLGVCCDKAGDIYILMLFYEEDETQLHHYSAQGKFIGSLVNDLDGHVDVTFTPDGKLAMCGSKSTQIFH